MKKIFLFIALFFFLFSFQFISASEELKSQMEEVEKIFSLLARASGFGATSIPEGFYFVNNLKVGSIGDEVRYLQIVLNSDIATQIVSSGPGSAGQETIYFGPATHRAVIKFQEKYAVETLQPIGLVSGTGVVGSLTRKKLNQIAGNLDNGGESNSEILIILSDIRRTIDELKRRLDNLEIANPKPRFDATGEINCHSSTENTISISYSTEDGIDVSLFRGTTRIERIGSGDKSGTYVDRNLATDTSYQYHLYNGATSTSDRLDTLSCRTREIAVTNSYYLLKGVTGIKGAYLPKEAINNVRIEAKDSETNIATAGRGFTVRVNIYSHSGGRSTLVTPTPPGSTNATYNQNTQRWEFSALAPENPGLYSMEVILGCSGGTRDCSSLVAGSPVKETFYFTVHEYAFVRGTGIQARTIDLQDSNWENAKKQCEGLGGGWELPTINQLKTLYQERSGFGGFRNKNYWSRTVDGNSAKALNFNNGSESSLAKTNSAPSVRCTRVFSSVEIPGEFTIRAYDNGAGTWEYAKEYCESLGWKLPNLSQARTMVGKKGDIGGFFGGRYWTINKPNTNQARTINARTELEELIGINSNIAFRCIKEN